MPVKMKKWAERELREAVDAREDEKIGCTGTDSALWCPQ